MRFRLYYEGALRATQGESRDGQQVRNAAQKQEMRKGFHTQLKQLWATDKFLSTAELDWDTKMARSPADASVARWGGKPNRAPMAEVIASRYQQFGYRFVPLVRKEVSLLCSLQILLLRRDPPGSLWHAGDIDNRIKTLIDTLRCPKNINELAGNEKPSDGEDPFFCLLEDDDQVTHLNVETDVLLAPAIDHADRSKVRLVITVELRPYHVTMDNLSFA